MNAHATRLVGAAIAAMVLALTAGHAGAQMWTPGIPTSGDSQQLCLTGNPELCEVNPQELFLTRCTDAWDASSAYETCHSAVIEANGAYCTITAKCRQPSGRGNFSYWNESTWRGTYDEADQLTNCSGLLQLGC